MAEQIKFNSPWNVATMESLFSEVVAARDGQASLSAELATKLDVSEGTKLRDALAIVIDSGQKNLLQDGDASKTANRWVNYTVTLPAGKYVVYIGEYSSTDTDSTTAQGYFFSSSDSTISSRFAQTKAATDMWQEVTVTGTTSYLRIYASDNATHSQSGDSVTCAKVMVCPAALWEISHKYVPYCPSSAELYAMIQAL